MIENKVSDASDDLARIYENVRDVEWWQDKLLQRTAATVSKIIYDADGIDFAAADWDNLIVLDACRADLFEEVLDLSQFDDYRRVRSNASLTAEWVKKNFRDRELKDTVYVTSNPHVSVHASDSFYKLIELWDDEFSAEHYTVLPEDVTSAALEAYEDDKRFVVHYLQPHQPYYRSDLWEELKKELTNEKSNFTNPLREMSPRPWKALDEGRYDREDFWTAYGTNLRQAFRHVREVLTEIEGRTIITSDHGELFGEPVHPLFPVRFYGHPTRGLKVPELVEVPWAVIEDDRRDITAGSVTPVEAGDREIVKERLAHLGYK